MNDDRRVEHARQVVNRYLRFGAQHEHDARLIGALEGLLDSYDDLLNKTKIQYVGGNDDTWFEAERMAAQQKEQTIIKWLENRADWWEKEASEEANPIYRSQRLIQALTLHRAARDLRNKGPN